VIAAVTQTTRLRTVAASSPRIAAVDSGRTTDVSRPPRLLRTSLLFPDRTKGRELMSKLIESVSQGISTALAEVITLGRTLKKRAVDVLAYFDRPGTSNGPPEAINVRLEHLRGSALGFRNLTNYIARSLLETGGFRPQLHPRM
jgi:hypothetical protein